MRSRGASALIKARATALARCKTLEEVCDASSLMGASAAQQRSAALRVINRSEELWRLSPFGESALHFAARRNLPCLVELFAQCGLELSMKDQWGYTPLHEACLYGSERAMARLLDLGASPAALNQYGDQPIRSAAAIGRDDMCEALIKAGGELSSANAEGVTPWLAACAQLDKGSVRRESLRRLIALGAGPNDQDKLGWSALHASCSEGDEALERSRALLELGCDPNLKDALGATALARALSAPSASASGSGKTVALLLDQGADPWLADGSGAAPAGWGAEEADAAGWRVLRAWLERRWLGEWVESRQSEGSGSGGGVRRL